MFPIGKKKVQKFLNMAYYWHFFIIVSKKYMYIFFPFLEPKAKKHPFSPPKEKSNNKKDFFCDNYITENPNNMPCLKLVSGMAPEFDYLASL